MPVFNYKVMDKKGNKKDGKFSASNKNEVLAMIRENEYYPLYVEEENESKKTLGLILAKVTIKDLAVFCRQFATLLDAGADMLNSVNLLRKQTINKKMKSSLDEIYEEIQKGHLLSASMRNYEDVFPKLLVNMIESGEETGTLSVIMERMAEQYEKENKINKKIKGALIYPMILIVVSIAVVTFLLTFIIPTFISLFEGSGVELPGPTKVIVKLSSIVKDDWYIIILITALIVVGFKIISKVPSVRKQLDKAKLSFPVIKSTARKIVALRFTTALSTVLYSGVSMISGLEIVSKVVGNKVAEDGLMDVREKIVRGIPLNEALEQIEVFPPMVTSMVKIGEESGAMDKILDKTSKFYEQEVEEALQKMTTMIEPMLILVVGIIVGFIVIAMVMPMFDMYEAIS